MEFLRTNYINTTTVIGVGSSTSTAKNIFKRDELFQWASFGFNNDLTTASLTITFPATLPVSRIALINHNIKDYNIFYDGVTANTFSFSTTSSTITSQFTSNSETSQYFAASTIQALSVTFDFKKTQTANLEKAVGYVLLSDLFVNFERVPSSKNYKPKIDAFDIRHKLSDGGIRIHRISDKFSTTIKFKHITTTFRDSLKTAFDLQDEFVFSAFPTATGWDKIMFPVVWDGDFDFFNFSDDAVSAGFGGRMKLSEVPT
ncbi:MAG: hypothetical protein V3T32_06735 [Thermodesulfobacteriota bacterium]